MTDPAARKTLLDHSVAQHLAHGWCVLLLLTVCGLGGADAFAQARTGPNRLAVAVTTDDAAAAESGGLTPLVSADTRAKRDSANDIRRHLRSDRRRHIRPAREGEQPVVTVVVTGREYRDLPDELFYVYATISVGDTQQETSATGGMWRDAALNLVKQLDEWVAANKVALTQRR